MPLKPRVGLAVWVLLLGLALIFPASPAGAATWSGVVAEVTEILGRAVDLYTRGETAAAKAAVDDAYFGVYEARGMESAVRLHISARQAAAEEYGFTQLKRLITRGAPVPEVAAARDELVALLEADAAQLGAGPGGLWADFLSSFLIIVREGLEAILILAALIAYLVKSGNANRVRSLYGSAGVAVAASLVTAYIAGAVLSLSGAGQEVLEGITMLVAVAVLFYVSYWLLSKVEADRWQQYIRGKVAQSVGAGNSLALWSIVFLAVYREGAETVLFYRALLGGGAAVAPLVWGLAAGAGVLLVLFYLIRLGGVRLPLKPFFAVTGTFLYFMAFVFTGQGIRELQEGGVLTATPAGGVPVVDWLGIYPTWESLGLQAVLLLLVPVALAFTGRRGREALP